MVIFKVVIIFGCVFFWDMDRGVVVSDVVGEGVDRVSFVMVGKVFFVIFVVYGNMFGVVVFEFFDGGFDVFYVVFFMYFFGGEVVVKIGIVLVVGNGFGVERDFGIEFFGYMVEEEVRELEVVIYFDIFVRVDLVFLLSGYYFGVGVRDFDVGI